MQSELFEQPNAAPDQPAGQAMGGVIPLRRETPVMRAMRRIRSVMAKGLAPVIAFSSGKDSSSLANLVLNTAREMKEQGEQPMPILVVHSNTGVEQPEIAQLAKDELAKMKVFAKKHGLEVEVRIGQPTLSASFPVRVIGGLMFKNDTATHNYTYSLKRDRICGWTCLKNRLGTSPFVSRNLVGRLHKSSRPWRTCPSSLTLNLRSIGMVLTT